MLVVLITFNLKKKEFPNIDDSYVRLPQRSNKIFQKNKRNENNKK